MTVAEAQRRVDRGEERGVVLGDVLADAMESIGSQLVRVYRNRANRAFAVEGMAFAGDDPTPTVSKDDLFDIAVWDEAIEESENLIAAAVIDEMGVVGVAGTIRQPFVESVVRGHVAQVEAYGAAAQSHITSSLDRAFRDGMTIDETAALLRSGPFSESAARLVARTEMISASNGGARIAYMAIAQEGDTFVWLATPDQRTRPEHRAANGQEVALNEPFVVGGEQCMYPGESTLSLAMRGNCRCSFYLKENKQKDRLIGAPEISRAVAPAVVEIGVGVGVRAAAGVVAKQAARRAPNLVATSGGYRGFAKEMNSIGLEYGDDSLFREWANDGDPMLGALLKRQGFDSLPEVLSSKEFADVVAAEQLQTLYRGLRSTNTATGAEFAEQFARGGLYAGKGIYGGGTYTTPDPEFALTYGDADQVLLEMALKPDARIITHDEVRLLRTEMMKKGSDFNPSLRQLNALDDAEEAYRDAELARAILADEGRLATALGYDAIVARGGDEYVVLNRGALIMKEP